MRIWIRATCNVRLQVTKRKRLPGTGAGECGREGGFPAPRPLWFGEQPVLCTGYEAERDFSQAVDSREGPNRRNECWEGVSSPTGLGAQSKTPRDLIDRRAIGRGVEIWRGPGEHSKRKDPDRTKYGLGRSAEELARILERWDIADFGMPPAKLRGGMDLGGPA